MSKLAKLNRGLDKALDILEQVPAMRSPNGPNTPRGKLEATIQFGSLALRMKLQRAEVHRPRNGPLQRPPPCAYPVGTAWPTPVAAPYTGPATPFGYAPAFAPAFEPAYAPVYAYAPQRPPPPPMQPPMPPPRAAWPVSAAPAQVPDPTPSPTKKPNIFKRMFRSDPKPLQLPEPRSAGEYRAFDAAEIAAIREFATAAARKGGASYDTLVEIARAQEDTSKLDFLSHPWVRKEVYREENDLPPNEQSAAVRR